MTAIILAGGKSSRMKTDKALLPVGGIPLIRQIAVNLGNLFDEILISTGMMDDHPGFRGSLPYPVTIDLQPDQGPLMGILCGLLASSNPVNFVIACDIPEIDPAFIDDMKPYTKSFEIVMPVSGENHYEPLFAFYNRSLIPRIEDLLNQGRRKILELFPLSTVKYVPMKPGEWYFNLNTEEDYRRYTESRAKKRLTSTP